MKVLVAGATGQLGRAVVAVAAAAGHSVRAMSRGGGPSERMETGPSERTGPAREWVTADLQTGKGLVAALDGVDAVVHAASDPKRSTDVDVNGTRTLLDVARRVNVRHILYVSIVGIDQIPLAYYQAKLRAEELVETANLPYSILRATQFHGFIDVLLTRAAGLLPFVMPLPSGFHVQSVAVEDVAIRIVRALADGPKQRLRDFGGPDTMSLLDAATAWQRARGVEKRIVPVPIPGKLSTAFRAGLNIAWNGDHGTVGWMDWLTRESSR
jgi:uncharacterized protein YbjT (DUF2867 family)